jgi:hypothetical protein
MAVSFKGAHFPKEVGEEGLSVAEQFYALAA